MTETSGFEVEVADGVARVAFDRVEQRNSVTVEMFDTFTDIVSALSVRDDVFLVVLTGKGATFCPGADLRGPESVVGASSLPLPREGSNRSALLLRGLPQITIAAINGACAGAGLAWALACDLRIASASARFATAFLETGLPGELGIAWSLQRIAGAAVSRDLLLLPRKLDAEEARSLGLVHRVEPADAFPAAVDALVEELSSRGADVLRAMKQNFLDADSLTMADFVDAEAGRLRRMLVGEAGRRTLDRLRMRSDALRASGAAHSTANVSGGAS